MPTRVDYHIPPPTTWQSFESLCRDLWAEIWNDSNTQKHGRQGQPQHGVDVYGQKGKQWVGLQAKEKGQLPATTLSVQELKEEVKKAEKFKPKLKEYIVATTGASDAKVQSEARKITQEHKKKKLFSVTVSSWEDIQALLKLNEKIFRLHYPQLFQDIDAKEKTLEEINNLKLEMQKGFKHFAEQASVGGGDITQEHQAEIDYAKKLIDQHKPQSALDYIEPLRDRIWNQANKIVKFRLLTNTAAAKLQLGNEKEAATIFIKALQYNPEEEKALCNVALAYILLNNPLKAEKYIKKVLKKNPASDRALSLLIQIRADASIPVKKIIDEIPIEYRDLPGVAYALGSVCRKNHDFFEALKWLEKSKRFGPEFLISKATTLLASISDKKQISFAKKLSQEERDKVTEALEIFEKAWIEVKSYEDKDLKLECLANKGICHILLENYDKASVDYDDVLVLEGDNHAHLFTRAYIDYVSDKKELALQRLKDLSKYPDIPAAILVGDIYLATKVSLEVLKKEALPVVEDYIKLNPIPFFKTAAERLLVQIHITLNELNKAKVVVDKLVKKDPKDINSLTSKSRVYRLLKDEKTADETLAVAESFVDNKTHFFDIIALAEEYESIGKFDKAAMYYEKIVDIQSDSDLTRRLTDCYLKSGNKQKALEVCQSIRKKHGLVKRVLELEILLHEDIDDLKTAEMLCSQYLKENPDDIKMRLHLAFIHQRQNNLVKVDKFLKQQFDYKNLPLRYKIGYAELLSIRGFEKEAIITMYEIRRQYFDQSDVHLAYTNIFLRRGEKKEEWIDRNKVSLDTAVLIEEKNGVKTWYIIEDRQDSDFGKNELTPQHALSKKLFNKKVGEEVELVTTGPQKKYGKIMEIKSKYVYAFQDGMTNYQKRFPEAQGLYGIDLNITNSKKATKEDFKIILEQVDKQQEHFSKVMNLYKEGKLTIGQVAKAVGRNEIEAWGLLISQPDINLLCSIGDATLRKNAEVLLDNNPKLVIDVISLMTIHGVEIADVIVEKYGKLLISQSTLDIFINLVTNRKGLHAKGFLTLGKQGGQYVKEKVSAKRVGENTKYLKSIIEWVKKNCIITPCQEALKLNEKQREKMYELLGKSSFDSILIAKQERALLFSDDAKLRAYAKSQNVDGLWSQVILENLLTRGIISNEIYQKAIIKLVNSNYSFISINADTLIEATQQSKWKIDGSLTRLLELLNGSKCDDIPAIIVASDYVIKLHNQPLFLDDPAKLIYAVLDNAVKGRGNRSEFIRKLRVRLQRLHPLGSPTLFEIEKILTTWLNMQIVQF